MAEKYIVTVERVEEGGSALGGLILIGLIIFGIYWALSDDPVNPSTPEPAKVERTAIDINAMEEGPAKNIAKTLDLKPCSQVPQFSDSEVLCLKD
jgi:hypothetical protein